MSAGAGESATYSAPVPLKSSHRVDDFDCGEPLLDGWLATHALGNEGKASRTYVITPASDGVAIAGYYSLATGSVSRSELARRLRHNLPDPVPVLILGRLAVDRRHAGAGLGSGMVREALARTAEISRVAGVRMLIVHALGDEAVRFHARHGFRPFGHGARTLYLPIESILETGQRTVVPRG